MKQIRMAVFETNSSSVHSLSIMSVENYEKWKKGELLFDRYRNILATPEEAEVEIKGVYRRFESYEDYNSSSYEDFEMHYTTESGDEIVAFGYYGMDN